MQNSKHTSGVVSGIMLPIGLICLFAFCSLALALLGGRAYKQIQTKVDDGFNSTVAASYLRTKLSHNNRTGSVSLREEQGIQMLVIESVTGGQQYETRIYVKDGYLIENFERADADFASVSGMRIAQVDSCVFTLEDGLFTAEITTPLGSVVKTSFAIVEGGRL